jgi:hypothetical protein
MSYRNLSPDQRALLFRQIFSRPQLLHKERIEAAALLVDAEGAGDFEAGGMNDYAKRVLGYDIRRGFQGIYEAANVLRAIRAGRLAVSEEIFRTWASFPIIKVSGLLSKQPEKLSEAIEIIRLGKDTTNRLNELCRRKKI